VECAAALSLALSGSGEALPISTSRVFDSARSAGTTVPNASVGTDA